MSDWSVPPFDRRTHTLIDRILRTHFDRILGIYLGSFLHTIRIGYSSNTAIDKVLGIPRKFRILGKSYIPLGIPHTPVRRLGI